MLNKIWEFVVRLRTWLFNGAIAVVVLAPEILNAPEILAVVPQQYQRYFLAGLFVFNIWMRPRPAVMAQDPEAEVTRLRKAAPGFRGTDLP